MKLQDIRKEIDQLDSEMLALLNKRVQLAESVWEVKKKNGTSVFAPEREEALLRRLVRENEGPLSKTALHCIYREILSASRQRQKQLIVAYLGPQGTHCHHAALKRFGSSDELSPCRTIPEIFQQVERSEADTGVVPIENSIEGGVNAAHDALIHSDLNICGEIYDEINHVLASKEGTEKIKRVYSHAQALGQCRHYLNENYPKAERIEVASTAKGALLAAEEKGAAAICSHFSAQISDLAIIDKNIQDNQRNLTRFLIISKNMPAATGKDKTSLMFSVNHQVGALSQILQIFSDLEINLHNIESRPVVQKPWEYLFFVDVAGHCHQTKLGKALEQLQKHTLLLRILGSYPQADPHV
ncbi:MAG: prephenate dehydratase [Verrucomicrobiota bacterium]